MISLTAASSRQRWLEVDDVAAEQLAGLAGGATAEGKVQVPRPEASCRILVVGQHARGDRRDGVAVVGEDESAPIVSDARNLPFRAASGATGPSRPERRCGVAVLELRR